DCQQNFFPGIKHLHSSASLGLKSGNLTSHTHWAKKRSSRACGADPGEKRSFPPAVPWKNADESLLDSRGLGGLCQAGRPPSPAGQPSSSLELHSKAELDPARAVHAVRRHELSRDHAEIRLAARPGEAAAASTSIGVAV